MTDNVNHPKHYNSNSSGIECIDIVETMGFNLGNAIKYLYRCKFKNGQEDLKKALWYVTREKTRRQIEIWKTYPSDPRYKVSCLGNIRKIDNKSKNRKPVLLKNGYATIVFVCNKKHVCKYLHRIVAETFLGKPSVGHTVSHKNGIRNDNRIYNLEYRLLKDNITRKKLHNTSYHGERNPAAKLTLPQVLSIRREYSNLTSHLKLGKKYNVSASAVSRVVNNISWQDPIYNEAVNLITEEDSLINSIIKNIWNLEHNGATDNTFEIIINNLKEVIQNGTM